jgi:CDP-diacylglycerol--glycerol-3-phosphate 3-phosphatidyltransferase
VLRLLAAPAWRSCCLYFSRPWADFLALTLFVGAAITDYFDGYLARLWKQEAASAPCSTPSPTRPWW